MSEARLVLAEYLEYLVFLAMLFNQFEKKEFRPDDESLEADITKAISAIQEIQNYESKRVLYYKKTAKYVSHKQSPFNVLGSILEKMPMRIAVGFRAYEIPPKFSPADMGNINTMIAKGQKKFIKLKKQWLPNFEFKIMTTFSSPVVFDSNDEDGEMVFTEKGARQVLSYGIFYYLRDWTMGKRIILEKCGQCEEWFWKNKKCHAYCSKSCNNKHYAASVENRERRTNAVRRYREKVKSKK